jgi:hypothetical protein
MFSLHSRFSIFTLDVAFEYLRTLLRPAFALDIVHLVTIQFISLCFQTSLVIVYDVTQPVAGSTMPEFVSFSISLAHIFHS